MKLIRTYALLAVLNWMFVSLVVVGVPELRNRRTDTAQPLSRTTPAPDNPTPTPKRRVVHVKRVTVLSPTGSPSGVSVGQSVAPSALVPQAAATPAPDAAPTADPRCIITIDGVSYDVSQFRSMHSGGNVFTCGADMSATFWSRHGAGTLNAMARYRL